MRFSSSIIIAYEYKKLLINLIQSIIDTNLFCLLSRRKNSWWIQRKSQLDRKEFFMTNHHSIFKTFMQYVSFHVFGMIGLSCYILADTFFIAQALGTDGLTALNIAIPVYSLIHGMGLMIGTGSAIQYCISHSKQQQYQANQTFTNAIQFGLLVGVVFVIIGLLGAKQISSLLGADHIVHQMTTIYLRFILLFAPMFLINNILLNFTRNDKNPRLAMFAMLGGSLSNIVLDYVFLFPCQMGIFGAVLATGLAPIISIGILSIQFVQKQNQFHLIKTRLLFQNIKRTISLGISSLIAELSSGIVIVVFNFIILKLQGNVGVAAYGVIANLSLVVTSIFTGIAQGMQPLISYHFGCNHTKEVGQARRYAFATAMIISIVVYVITFLGADTISLWFNKEQDNLFQEIAIYGLRIYFLAFFCAGPNIIIAMYFSARNQPKPAFFISLLRGFIVIIPAAWILSNLFQMTGVWLSFPISELLVIIITLLFFKFFPSQKIH